MKKLLIANRGEIAIRIAHTAADLGLATVAIHSEDDAPSPHVTSTDEAEAISGRGVGAYLDIRQIVDIAKRRQWRRGASRLRFLEREPRICGRCRKLPD